ncbi:MAG: 2OG-Fe dioxygenase family protein [Acidobacteriota bacterium]
MRQVFEQRGSLSDWAAFAASWNDLEQDTYLDDSSRYRQRRYAVYSATAEGGLVREPHQPHYQHAEYNPLFGGIERWFAPVSDRTANGPTLKTILGFCRGLFDAVAPATRAWHIEVHQFRIEPRAGAAGHPTPEGVHRDGADFVLVLLVSRQNIESGTTTTYDAAGRPLGSFTLTDPFDAAVVDDHRVAHGVTPVRPFDPAVPASRDVLVVSFRRVP